MTEARQRCPVVVRGDRAERHSNPLLNQPVELGSDAPCFLAFCFCYNGSLKSPASILLLIGGYSPEISPQESIQLRR